MIDYVLDNATSLEAMSPWGRVSWTEPIDTSSKHESVSYELQRHILENIRGLVDSAVPSPFGRSSQLQESFGSALTESTFLFELADLPENAYSLRVWSSLSTATETQNNNIIEDLAKTFASANDEVFEHGMESAFSLSLAGFIEAYQGMAIETIAHFLAGGTLDKAVAMETLRQLGLSEHEPTYDARKDLLLQHLNSELAMIRYGSMYGLSSMDDPGTIPEISQAYQQETYPDLLDFMRVVLDQLEDTETGV